MKTKKQTKRSFLVILCFAIMLCMMAPGHIAQAAPEVKVQVDGQLVDFPDQKPYIDSASRTMVPVRAPMEAMGCTVDWNDQARQATIKKDGNVAVFTIGSKTYTVNGASRKMDTYPVIVNDRTAFPIRFAAEAMGATVGWNASAYTVLITTPKPSGIVLLPTTGLPGRDVGVAWPNYSATIPFVSAKGTEITGLEYRDGAVRLQMGPNPAESIQLYAGESMQAATLFIGGAKESTVYSIPGGYESEYKLSDLKYIQEYEKLGLFLPGDGLYFVPNPFI